MLCILCENVEARPKPGGLWECPRCGQTWKSTGGKNPLAATQKRIAVQRFLIDDQLTETAQEKGRPGVAPGSGHMAPLSRKGNHASTTV